jgi:hypothetical protein
MGLAKIHEGHPSIDQSIKLSRTSFSPLGSDEDVPQQTRCARLRTSMRLERMPVLTVFDCVALPLSSFCCPFSPIQTRLNLICLSVTALSKNLLAPVLNKQ